MSRTSRHTLRSLAWRERWHRVAIAAGISTLLVLSGVALFGHDFAGRFSLLLSGTDHIGSICVVAVHVLLAPVHRVFHLLILSGIAYAVWDRIRAARTLERTLRMLTTRAPAPGDAFWTASLAAGLDPARVRIVNGLPTPAFTAGWWMPRLFIARALTDTLSPEELAAVFQHEAAHVRRRDPLTFAALRFLSHIMWWLPAVRNLSDDVVDEVEIAADDRAAAHHPLALASALLALTSWRERLPGHVTAPGIASVDLLDRRVRRLVGESVPIRTHVTRRSLAWALAVCLPLALSGVIMVHPLMAASTSHPYADHCAHHRGTAFRHLFCLRHAVPAQATVVCPHVHRALGQV